MEKKELERLRVINGSLSERQASHDRLRIHPPSPSFVVITNHSTVSLDHESINIIPASHTNMNTPGSMGRLLHQRKHF